MAYFNSILCLLLLGTLLQANLVWSSDVFVQNNSDEEFTYHCESFSNELSREYWTCDSGPILPGSWTILPGRRKRVAYMNRDKGITRGRTFNIRQYLKLDGHDVVFLAQRLKGNLIGSDISYSIKGQDEFYWDSGVLRTGGPYYGTHYYGGYHVRYQAYFTGGPDNIEYIITKKKHIDLPSTKNDTDEL